MNLLQTHDTNFLENCQVLIGVDEAGRGALAGPVYAGACVFGGDFFASDALINQTAGINDSKQVSPEGRDEFFAQINELKEQGHLDVAVASGSVEEIAELNILGATRLAMQRAMEALSGRSLVWDLPQVFDEEPLFAVRKSPSVRCIVDGRPLKPFPYAHEGIVKGDGKSLAIAIASIAAKVSRDHEMKRLAESFPEYGFEVHKGYGTVAHREAILRFGPCEIHRGLFLRKILA